MARRGIVNKDVVGKRFGSMTVLDDYIQVDSSTPGCHHTKWRCRCDCGAERYIVRSSLLKIKTNTCPECRKPGIRNEKLYHVYYGILQRCNNVRDPSYKKYGGKGVKVCDEWATGYAVFKEWAVENGYKEGLTIDRIDSDGDYEPSNCRWITLSENSARANVGRHKNKTKLEYAYAISPDGQKLEIDNMLAFSRQYGIKHSTVSAILHGRMKNHFAGWTFFSNKTVV